MTAPWRPPAWHRGRDRTLTTHPCDRPGTEKGRNGAFGRATQAVTRTGIDLGNPSLGAARTARDIDEPEQAELSCRARDFAEFLRRSSLRPSRTFFPQSHCLANGSPNRRTG